jgi:V8-like Glu-specific endopeptidase
MNTHKFVFAVSLAMLLATAPPTHAQGKALTLVNPHVMEAAAYWTPERFAAATPLEMPHVAPGAAKAEEPSATPEGKAESSDPHAPAALVRPEVQHLFVPDATQEAGESEVAVPGAVGTFGAHYTSSRVFPLFTGADRDFSADLAWPYITVGKLFFSINGKPYVCSGSVIQHRIVATAGHCVHNGNGELSGFYDNWVFVPAYRDGTAPLLVWHWEFVDVTDTWAFGGGGVPNAADYALLEFGDQSLDGQSFSLGDVTGWLGWQTLSLSANHTSKLGYPCNLDRCQKMQVITSGAFRNTRPNNVEYGSDALGGSSGGPWVQNFGGFQAGGGTGSNNGDNRVVGVTSYIYVPADPKVQGASILDRRWVDLFNETCGFEAGNCL